MMKVQRVWSYSFLVVALSVFSIARLQGQTLQSLNPNPDGTVYGFAAQPDGKILINGEFSTVAGQPHRCIARLNADGTVDGDFQVQANDWVRCLTVQPDGKVLIGGDFTTISGQPRNHLARLNPDGTLDPTFAPAANGYVRTMLLLADGKILVGGDFTTLSDQPCSYVGRLTSSGQLDATFVGAADDAVRTLALQPDGNLVIGGDFVNFDGQPRSFIARCTADGLLDADFNPGADDWVHCVAVQPDGKILVGGEFTMLAGSSQTNFGRLMVDGSLDSSIQEVDGWVQSIALQTDGKIIVGGLFGTLAGQPCNYVGRLNSDGSLDSGFSIDVDDWVYSLAIQADGAILIGGDFANAGGQTRFFAARFGNTTAPTQSIVADSTSVTWSRGDTSPEIWRATFEVSTDGSTWSPLGVGQRSGTNWLLSGVVIPANATIRARGFATGGLQMGSGYFVEANLGAVAVSAQPLSRTNNAGTTAIFKVLAVGGSGPLTFQWQKNGTDLSNGANISGALGSTLTLNNLMHADAAAYSVRISDGSRTITSSSAVLTVVDPAITQQPTNQWARLGDSVTFSVNAAGTDPISFQWRKNGTDIPGATANSYTIPSVQAGDAAAYSVVVSNQFATATSDAASLLINMVTLDAFDPGANYAVYTTPVLADGTILAGGAFRTLGGQSVPYMARIAADGTADGTFSPNPSDSVFTSLVQPDGKILIGGPFTSIGAQNKNHLARLNADGTLDTSFTAEADYSISALVSQADGKILVVGQFTNLAGGSCQYIGRLNPDGVLDTTFNVDADNWIHSVAVQPDGKILIVGRFSFINGQPRQYIARLNPDGSVDSTFAPDANDYVYSIALQPDGKILVGGWFTEIAGESCDCLARLNIDGTFDSTFNAEADASVSAMALQTDGKILVGGNLTELDGSTRNHIGRLNPDGSLDTVFFPDANDTVWSLVIQPDGSILVGGEFTMLSGQSRAHLARLGNTAPATQSLTTDGSSITWLRGGSGPEVWQTTFEVSSDGTQWTLLGSGTRVPSGWKLGGVTVPTDGFIRARGYVSGNYNASSWFAETVVPASTVAQLRIITTDSHFGMVGNSFGFNITGPSGQAVAVDMSTDLKTWTPLTTNTLSSTPLYFNDSNAPSSARYYRLREVSQ